MDGADQHIAAVFFDFGGVISLLDQEKMSRLERRYGLPEGGFPQAMYDIPEWRALEVGKGSEEAWLEAAGRKLDELAGRPIPDIREEWSRISLRLDAAVVDLAERLRQRYRVGLISNAALDLEDILRDHLKIDHLFEVVVNSARVGVAKPDKRIFHVAAERVGVEPAACLHIDDLWPNVHGAREAGFQAIHYDGDFSSLERKIRSLGMAW